jgi:hypothetical protein
MCHGSRAGISERRRVRRATRYPPRWSFRGFWGKGDRFRTQAGKGTGPRAVVDRGEGQRVVRVREGPVLRRVRCDARPRGSGGGGGGTGDRHGGQPASDETAQVWQAGYFNDRDREFHRTFDRPVDELLAAFRRGEEPPVQARAGYRALELTYAAIESFETGRRVATA